MFVRITVEANGKGFHARIPLEYFMGYDKMQETQKVVFGVLEKMGVSKLAAKAATAKPVASASKGETLHVVTRFQAWDDGHYHSEAHEGVMSVASMNEAVSKIAAALFALGDA